MRTKFQRQTSYKCNLALLKQFFISSLYTVVLFELPEKIIFSSSRLRCVMASGNGNVENGEPLTPEKIAPRASSRENSPVTQPPRKNLPDTCSAVQAGKKRRHAKAAKKPAQKHMKGSKKRRSKSRRYSSSSSSPSSSSSATSSSTSDSDSEATSRPASRVNESLFSRSTSSAKGENTVSEEIVDFAATAAFEGLAKSARKSIVEESPVPFHDDLRPKKVDSFIKKFLKRKGANFNPTMDRRQLNLAGRILDPIGPLSLLWQTALSAQSENTGIDPAVVVEAIQRAISLIGNASHCALVDRRKGLLAKVSPETLDLIDDPALFVPGTPELFGKKFKKAVFKDLKLSKEMDSLISTSGHGNGRKQFKPFQPFRQQPGKGPGYNPRAWSQRGWTPRRGGFSQQRGKTSFFPNQGKQG